MSSLDLIYRKMSSSLERNGAGHAQESKFDPARHIPPAVAHELNNILTIIQGYADRLLIKHGENPALEQNLKLITEATRRATYLVRDATPPSGANGTKPSSPEENSLTTLMSVS
jgi:nitrogen-specific signal transduction histidine kinase